MYQLIKIKRSPSFGKTDIYGRMYLQRRGISQDLEYGNAEYAFYVVRRSSGAIDVSIDEKHIRFSASDGTSTVENYLFEKTGKKLLFAQQTEAYCFSSPMVAVEKDDLFFSPLAYQESTDTIRHWPTNICVVAFEEGDFKRPILDFDRGSACFQPSVEKALKCGFHSCDERLGANHMKRRLAWLAGNFIIDEHFKNEPDSSLTVAVLQRDMSSPGRVPYEA